MKARVHVMLKNGVLDPQGEAVRHALGALGFDGDQPTAIHPKPIAVAQGPHLLAWFTAALFGVVLRKNVISP